MLEGIDTSYLFSSNVSPILQSFEIPGLSEFDHALKSAENEEKEGNHIILVVYHKVTLFVEIIAFRKYSLVPNRRPPR